MTDKRKSIFLLHLSLESVCVMTDTGAALLELYAAFGEPWWVGPLAMTADSCRGIGLWKVMQRTREAASPVAMTGGGAVGGAAPDTGGHLWVEAHYAQTVPTPEFRWRNRENIYWNHLSCCTARLLNRTCKCILGGFSASSIRFASAVLKRF